MKFYLPYNKLPFQLLLISFLILGNSFCIHAKNTQKDSLEIEKLLAVDLDSYTTLKERRKFYHKTGKLFENYGYEIRWLKVADKTVKQLELAYSKFGGYFAKTNAEIRRFLDDGNKAILGDMLPKVIELWRSGDILKDTAALNWDAQMLSDEQNLIDPYYEGLSKESQDILDFNLKRWLSVHILGNPRFYGYILEQEQRWEFGMIKMGYCVDASMMPTPEKNWKDVKLKIQSKKRGKIIVSK